METWIVADPDALVKIFGAKFDKSKLPPSASLEASDKKTLYSALATAAKPTPAGDYGKGQHSFRVLAEVAPAKLSQLTWGKRFLDAMGASK
jgi:hypothetical protein